MVVLKKTFKLKNHKKTLIFFCEIKLIYLFMFLIGYKYNIMVGYMFILIRSYSTHWTRIREEEDRKENCEDILLMQSNIFKIHVQNNQEKDFLIQIINK